MFRGHCSYLDAGQGVPAALLADVGVCPGRGEHEGGGEVRGRVGGAGAGPGHRGLLHREAGHLRVLGCDVMEVKYA